MARPLVLALAVAAALLLSGCSVSLYPSPPEELLTAADEYAYALRQLPGVTAAEAVVRAVDPKDDPGEWLIDLEVVAESPDLFGAVTDGVWSIEPPSGAAIAATVRFPQGSGVASVSVGDPSSAVARRARMLGLLPFVDAVSIDGTAVSLRLAPDTRLDDAAAAIRASDVLEVDPYDSVHVDSADDRVAVDISLAGPSAAVVDHIQLLAGDSTVQHVGSVEPTQRVPRPAVSVQTSEPDIVSSGLTGLLAGDSAGRSRTRFVVDGPGVSVSGFVGLPLRSPEPDDLPLALDGRDPTPPDVLAAHLETDTAALTGFLMATAEASAAPGSPEVFVVLCATPGMSRVEGLLLLEVFEVAGTAYPAYDAIVAGWERDGFDHTDQATGTSIYRSTVDRGVVEASIRGTAEGIQVAAYTGCRG